MRKTLGFVLATLLLATPASAAVERGKMLERSYTNAAGTRTYFLYAPPGGAEDKPLMVWLHGCGGPLTMEAGHALAKVADELDFVLAYPVQNAAANTAQCWNWFLDAHIHRGQGEASIIAGITTSLLAELDAGASGTLGIDRSRVYVGGYSAGGAMTTVMGATYPDLYAAISPQAGAPYNFDTGQKAFVEMGERARPVPAWLLQGATDEISNYGVGRVNLLQWLTTDDLADDGAANDSVAKTPASQEPVIFDTAFGPLLPTVVEHYVKGGCELAQFVSSPHEHLVNGYFISEDAGLELQRAMMRFLLSHRLGAPC
jgi:poly(hydroxyalkanoate) depolymerase family esterase